jgi:hypothetical protein
MVGMSQNEEIRVIPLLPVVTDEAPVCADGVCGWPGAQPS